MKIKAISIIIPVYGDWTSLANCLDSIIEHVDTSRHKVMLVNDCGPEADTLEKNIQKAITGKKGFEYFRNSKNLGFVKTCNRAVMELDNSNNDVLLLNSDTMVTNGFLDEMLSVLYDKSNIGAVSPRTNNATICTLPISAINQKGIEPDKSYGLFQKYKDKFPKYNIAPTAHGFCMLIRREVIKEYGLFDEVFGRGYGEETDFCQKILKDGWLSAISNQSYVFHQEARSFSLEAKAKILAENGKIIRSRYPAYKQSVTSYIENNLIAEGEISKELKGVGARPRAKTVAVKLIKRSRLYQLLRGD